MSQRVHTAIRLSEASLVEVDKVAQEFEKVRAVALRRLLALGLAAWQQGHRTPDTIKKAP